MTSFTLILSRVLAAIHSILTLLSDPIQDQTEMYFTTSWVTIATLRLSLVLKGELDPERYVLVSPYIDSIAFKSR